MGNCRVLAAIVVAFSLAGCATGPANPRLTLRYEGGLQSYQLDALISRAGPGPVAIVDLGRTAWVSHHLAVVRVGEEPHYHRFHDLTVMVLRGEGVLDLDGRKIAMKAGDVAHIQRGVRHFFRNSGSEPAASFVIFAPPYDGRDTVTAELPAAAETPEPPKKHWWKFWRRSAPEVPDAEPGAGEETKP
jgi:mannose-6-phosphate isomerase-like protein (cupin superfamily)